MNFPAATAWMRKVECYWDSMSSKDNDGNDGNDDDDDNKNSKQTDQQTTPAM